MKTYKILFLLFIALTFNSCETDIPFHIRGNPPKLVLNAIIDTNNENNSIYLSLTGKETVDSILNATVNIYINEELKDRITKNHIEYFYGPDSTIVSYYADPVKTFRTTIRFSPGDKVKIEAYANDGKYHAWAEDIIPKPIEIEQIDTSTYVKIKYNRSYSYIRMKTAFTDIPDERNFYRITLEQTETVHGKTDNGTDTFSIRKHYEYMDTREDVVLNDGKVILDDNFYIPQTKNMYCVFDDTRLNGTYTMTTSFSRPTYFYFDDYYNPIGFTPEYVAIKYEVRLISITEMQHYHLKALNLFTSDDYDEYLSMPIAFPSNVEGGIGLVGFSSGSDIRTTFSLPHIIPDTIPYWN